jgi:hypothetical protein
MSITQQFIQDGDSTIEIIDYGYITNSVICDIFGDELTYNQLKKYKQFEDQETYLVVKSRPFYGLDPNIKMYRYEVYFDNSDNEILNVAYSENHSSTMNYYLQELIEREDADESHLQELIEREDADNYKKNADNYKKNAKTQTLP